jgi:hypothetical protein
MTLTIIAAIHAKQKMIRVDDESAAVACDAGILELVSMGPAL